MSNNNKTLCLIFTFIIVVNVRLIKKIRINIKLISRLRVLKTNCSDFQFENFPISIINKLLKS
jgi:hypothetical protein